MPRRAGQLVSQGDSKWLVRVFRGRDAGGRRRYHSRVIHGTKKDAQRYLTKALRELDLGEFIEAFFIPAAQRGLEYLTIALPVKDPRLPALQRRFSTRSWHSRLYQVMWPGQSEVDLQDAPCLPDVALL